MEPLAIDGGAPVRPSAFPPWPHFAEDEVEAAGRVLRSGQVNYWTGEECRRFEAEFAAMLGSRHAISLANGTAALELALHALGIGPGDEVVVPSRTFIASASCVARVGAVPVVCDVDRDSGNLSAATVRQVLTPRTRAVVAVHLAGWPCDMDPLLALAAERGLELVEDCAQSHGATYKGRPVGTMGRCGAYSFCQDKIMTTGGEGGMLVTDDTAVWERAWAYKDHGKSWDAVFRRSHPPGFRWLHESFGTNWRMTEMQAAIGRLQLRKLPGWLERRTANARLLADALAGLPGLRVSMPGADVGHAWYKFYAYLLPEALAPGWDRDRVIEAVTAEGVPCFSGSCGEIYREQAFVRAGWGPGQPHTVARELAGTSVMFLVHPTLGDGEMRDAAAALRKVLAVAARPT
ncbi:MAG: DegT/DnrJ/EryC1/StrS aminotransferase family protein [Rhodocyclaceae bacterium]|nr:DegT/DnrJ/EryC1/StrS aminotransferase family protein [Rhodocyclaceae bacterium]